MIVFPVKVLTKIFSRENRSISNYAKYFCFNVTKKGVQMRDYCLNFESGKMAARKANSCRANSCPVSQRLGIKFGCNFRILDHNRERKGVFERRTSTGSEVFFILKHLDAPKFVFLSVLTIIETSCPKRWAKPLSKNEKRPLLVDVRRSKTSLLKFTNVAATLRYSRP